MNVFHEYNSVTLGSTATGALASHATAPFDTAGYDETCYVIAFGAVTPGAVVTIIPRENTALSNTVPVPTVVTVSQQSSGVITGGSLVLTDVAGSLSNKIVMISVMKNAQSKRYGTMGIVSSGGTFVINSVLYVQSKARSAPVTHLASSVVAVAQAAS